MTYIIFDMHNLAYICAMAKFYQTCKTPTGMPSGHVYGMASKINSIAKTFGKGKFELIFSFDKYPAFKYDIYPDYKGKRDKTKKKEILAGMEEIRKETEKDAPEIKDYFIDDAKTLTSFFPGKRLWAPHNECDDAIASFISQHTTEDDTVVVVTTDHDLWQLKHPNLTILLGAASKPLEEKMLTEKYNLNFKTRKKLALVKAIYGDTSDNIPKVRGVNWNDIEEAVISSANMKEFKQHVYDSAKKNKSFMAIYKNMDQVRNMYKIVRLRKNLPLKIREQEGDIDGFNEFMNKFACIRTAIACEHLWEERKDVPTLKMRKLFGKK